MVILVKTNDSIWTAGLLDGTGSIGLYKNHTHSNGNLKPRVSMTNSDSSLLDALQAAHGGFIKSMKVKAGWSPLWTWELGGADLVIRFLEPIYPYMRCYVKSERARLIVEEYRLVTKRNGVYSPAALGAKKDFEARFLRIGSKTNKEAMNMVMDRG